MHSSDFPPPPPNVGTTCCREFTDKDGFNTRAIHCGQKPEATYGSIIPPLFMTTTYVQDWPAHHKGYDYTRAGNPSFSALEEQIAALEGGQYATAVASGLSAFTACLSSLVPGDGVLVLNSCYGGTYRLLKRVFEPLGVVVHLVNYININEIEDVMKTHKPKMFLFETPTNPLMEVIDIEQMASLAKKYGVMTVADNTFASPYHQVPLSLGVDVVVHSSTKYLGGHSDIVGGLVVTNNKDVKDKIDFYRMAMGLNPSPFDCWMMSRSLKTLGVRMERHAANAMKLASYLSNHPKVSRVYYPGLETHEGYRIAKKQMTRGFSGIVSVQFTLCLSETMLLISNFRVFSLAESLGGVESLVDHPASMTHASIPKEEREKIGLSDGLVRFSVGIEESEDQIMDIENALNIVEKQTTGILGVQLGMIGL